MKVLHISTAKSWRGGEQQLLWLARCMKEQGHDVYVSCPSNSILTEKSVHENYVCFSTNYHFTLNPFYIYNLWKWIRKYNIKVIHAHDPKAHTIVWMLTRMVRVKTWVVSRKVAFPIRRNWLTAKKYRDCPLIICNSNATQQEVVKIGVNPQNIVLISDGIDLNRHVALPIRDYLKTLTGEEKKVEWIGIIGAMTPEKDHFTFIRVADHVCREFENVRFIIIGDGPLREPLEALVHQLALEGIVYMPGFQSDIVSCLKDMKVFLFTSIMEGLGTSIMEAMAAGVPVVATQTGGIPDIVIHEKTGLLGIPGDAASLSLQVMRLLQDGVLATTLANQAKENIQKLNIQRVAQQTCEAYIKANAALTA